MPHNDHSDTTASEPPLTPFSSRSLLSDGTHTSDEPGDLGAFPSVFRALDELNLQYRPPQRRLDLRSAVSVSESESDTGETAATWNTQIIDSYLDQDEPDDSISPYAPSDDEGDLGNSASSDTEALDGEEEVVDKSTPTLGNLDSALGFLAAEQAKLDAQLGVRAATSSQESPWRHVVEPKRRRRRKRKTPVTVPEDQPYATVVPTREASPSLADLSSSPDKGTLTTSDGDLLSPSNARRPRPKGSSQHLYIPSSLPSNNDSRSLQSKSLDPHLLRLRALAEKLRKQFSHNETSLKHILLNDFPENNLIDPRGPEPQVGDTLTHVFIDHSNILIGFLNYVKRSRRNNSGKPLLYFPALALILERGRSITRRVLATSSPLYQNMDIAKDLGYSVHVYARVPDLGDSTNGAEANGTNDSVQSTSAAPSVASNATGHRTVTKPRKQPVPLRNTTESDPGQVARTNRPNNTHSRSTSIPSVPLSPPAVVSPGRVRYREQGVDELLQLKLHQALVSPDADPPPAGATIVLATGDGASGQFNEDGFVGAVKTALKKGWTVELYAWTSGTSGVWKKLAEEGKGRFKIWTIDTFVGDLLE